MIHAANLVLVLIFLVNLTGLALVTRRFLGSWLLARCASPLVVAVPFFLEHFAGFGSLAWLWPVTTAASIFGIVREWRIFVSNWRIEAVFNGAFAYALAWRYAFPDIDASSEKMTDLMFIANYMSGARLPPVDRWLPPFRFDMYYALQHYAAALMARILAIPAGTAYNLAFCMVIAAAVTAAAGTAWLLVQEARGDDSAHHRAGRRGHRRFPIHPADHPDPRYLFEHPLHRRSADSGKRHVADRREAGARESRRR